MPRLLDAELMLFKKLPLQENIYIEKPTATDTATAIGLAETCEQAGSKTVLSRQAWLQVFSNYRD